MKQSRFSEEQIINALKEYEAGVRAIDICRRLGIAESTFYRWKARFEGLEVSDAIKLRALEKENAKLKRLLADALLDNSALKEVLSKKW